MRSTLALFLVSLAFVASGSAQVLPASVDGLAPAEWRALREVVSAEDHAVRTDSEGHVARNPGQAWKSTFDGAGLSVTPKSATWSWGLELLDWGLGAKRTLATTPHSTCADGGELSYRWSDNLTEWYRNDARGLEHGFTLDARPAGAADSVLSVRLAVRGGLAPVVTSGAKSVRFFDDTECKLEYAGLVAFDAAGRDLPAWIEAGEAEIRLCVDQAGALYPLTIDPVAQQTYLKASNAEAEDGFGRSVAISGNTVVIGADLEKSAGTDVNSALQADNSESGAGAAYVFVRNGGTWTQQAYLKASNTGGGDKFGFSVAIDGDTIVVGATGEASAANGVNGVQSDDSLLLAGSAYVFVRSGTVWTQQAYLKASNTGTVDSFGTRVAVTGNTIAVAATGEASNATGVNGNQGDNSALFAGAVYVFTRNGSSWIQEAYLKASNTGQFDEFGTSLALDGDTLLVGAPFEASIATGIDGNQTNNNAQASGAAYVFERNAGTWTQQAYLKGSNTQSPDSFGWSVDVSGDTAVVGANIEFGGSTGVNGNEGDNSQPASGAAYVFTRSGSVWSQEAYVKASNTQVLDQFGFAVAIDGDTLLVGAADEMGGSLTDGNQNDNSLMQAGAAYVFRRTGTSWAQTAYLKSDAPDDQDLFGFMVALDGGTAVISSFLEDSDATVIGGDNTNDNAMDSGAAHIFADLDTNASVVLRNGGTNPASYSATSLRVGMNWDVQVDLTSTGHSAALVFGYSSPTSFLLPGGGQTLLVIGNELFALPLQVGPMASWSALVPNDPVLVGNTYYSQAVHVGGVQPFALSNALDLLVDF